MTTATADPATKYDLRALTDLDVEDKRVLVRVDFNVPLNAEGGITDDTRIRAALPTIRYLIDHHAKVILASHLGRPKGKVSEKYSLAPVAARLTELLNARVTLAPDCVGPQVEFLDAQLQPGNVLLLENLRFHPEEEANDPEFSRRLAQLADVYVNDAFGTAHRAHASTEGVAHLLPSVAGFLMKKEVDALGGVLQNPAHPFTAIIGGAKISSKIGVLENLLDRVDALIIGGGMANTFFAAQGLSIGDSLVESDQISVASALIKRVDETPHKKLLLPVDVVIADSVTESANTRVVPVNSVPDGWAIVDVGPKSIQQFAAQIAGSKTILWNGPMGVFEIASFSSGTMAVAQALAESSAQTIVGGGDSVAAIDQMGLEDKMTHVSTGGGASLEFLEGRDLPGIAVLRRTKA
jgi:phosphoglycerate kinase